MFYGLVALLVAAVGSIPLFLRGRWTRGVIFVISFALIGWVTFYLSTPSTAGPFWGWYGGAVVLLWWVAFFMGVDWDGYRTKRPNGFLSFVPALIGTLLILGTWFFHTPLFTASQYAAMIGDIEERNWTADIQPKDPEHMRMVSYETATYLAQKAIGQGGAIGSQFNLTDGITLQRIGDEFFYVAPLDYAGFSVWTSTNGSPAYLKIDAEDPERVPELVYLPEGEEMQYTPGAFFSYNLTRHLRANGYLEYRFAPFRFEIDDEGNPWWVVSAYLPTIGWNAPRVEQLLTVNPHSGEIVAYATDAVPAWVDRVIPGSLVENYIDWHGWYEGGFLNSFWGKNGVTESELPTLIYGEDNNAEWVAGVTSTNLNDDALVGLMYVDSRTGRAVYYDVNGGATDTAILRAVAANQDVQFRRLRGTTPQIYNVAGVMAAVVPLVNDTNAYQGVAIVPVLNVQDVAVGDTQFEALQAFQSLLFRRGQQIALEGVAELRELTGIVSRITQDVTQTDSPYLLMIEGAPRIFMLSSRDYPALPVTLPGDTVFVEYVATGETTVPVRQFENRSLVLDTTQMATEVERAAQAMQDAEAARLLTQQTDGARQNLIDQIEQMTPEQLEQLNRLLAQ